MRPVALVGLLVGAALALPVVSAGWPSVEHVGTGRTELRRLDVPRELRVVSYYPSDAGWTLMWDRWRPSRFAADLRRLRGLNANTVRLVVSPSQFGYPTPARRYRDRLAQAVSLAAAAGLHVQLTLFDWWFDYADRSGSKRWAETILAPYVGDARIAFVELRNELDPADAGAVPWARELLPRLRAYLRGTPVTISVGNTDSSRDLRALLRGLGTAARPDFFTAHYFTGGGELAGSRFRQLQQTAAPVPLWIGEIGYPTSATVSGYWSLPLTRSAQEAAQSHFLKTSFAAARQLGLPRPGSGSSTTSPPARSRRRTSRRESRSTRSASSEPTALRSRQRRRCAGCSPAGATSASTAASSSRCSLRTARAGPRCGLRSV